MPCQPCTNCVLPAQPSLGGSSSRESRCGSSYLPVSLLRSRAHAFRRSFHPAEHVGVAILEQLHAVASVFPTITRLPAKSWPRHAPPRPPMLRSCIGAYMFAPRSEPSQLPLLAEPRCQSFSFAASPLPPTKTSPKSSTNSDSPSHWASAAYG